MGHMKMKYETKIGNVGGSATVVIPAGLVKLLEIEKGDKLIWTADIEGEGVTITVDKKHDL